ncbi:hypothetical protein FG167_02965 [Lacinutrix sp. WUR7]|uniref:hypothetical protein n=1 Tax=Lacinutrix sp. WUR7 TaxID=2653681 RepID=UPI00193CD263|nr:hypothetical protein [Lacinutrix sp. WUR7]QRM88226.1 hypothetical protein FG167_02965 [Lacinutrix sp. WUR7]
MLSQSTNSQDFEKVNTENSCIDYISESPITSAFEKGLVEFRPYLKKFDFEAEDVNMKIN